MIIVSLNKQQTNRKMMRKYIQMHTFLKVIAERSVAHSRITAWRTRSLNLDFQCRSVLDPQVICQKSNPHPPTKALSLEWWVDNFLYVHIMYIFKGNKVHS